MLHIAEVEHKISRAMEIISKLQHCMPKRALLSIYYDLVHSCAHQFVICSANMGFNFNLNFKN